MTPAFGQTKAPAPTPAAAAGPDLPLEGDTVEPNWLQKPSGEDFVRVYPRIAQAIGLPGEATITCAVSVQGLLEDCRVVAEVPLGLGFGAAAEQMSQFFRMKPATFDGVATRGLVTVPIKFQLDDGVKRSPDPQPSSPVAPQALELGRRLVAASGLQAQVERQYARYLVQVSSMDGDLASNRNPTEAHTALDAYRQALNIVLPNVEEKAAHVYAADMTVSQMSQALDFLNSSAGVAWRQEQQNGAASNVFVNFNHDVIVEAGRLFCQRVTCLNSAPITAAASPKAP